MENRAVLAFIISMVVITLWMFWFSPQPPPPEQEHTAIEQRERTVPTSEPVSEPKPSIPLDSDETDYQEELVVVSTPLYEAEFSSKGATVRSWKLKDYKERLSGEPRFINLVSNPSGEQLPLELRIDAAVDEAINSANFEFDRKQVILDSQAKGSLVASHNFSNGLLVKKSFTFYRDRYDVDVRISVCDGDGKPVSDRVGLVWPHTIEEDTSRWAGFSGPVVYTGENYDEIKDIDKYPAGLDVQWAGYTLKYFLAGIVPLSSDKGTLFLRQNGGSIRLVVSQSAEQPQSCQYPYRLFLGPKKISELRKSDHGLDKSVDFGFFDIIARPLLITLVAVNKYTHNYGIAIIILTILIKLLFWPLTHKSYASMKEMQKIQPRMKQVRERFKNDREQLNREMMLLYKTHKVNPLGGCLPMLLQIPVFFALYKALLGSIELRHAPFIFWVKDLAAPDYLLNFPSGVSIFGIEGIGPLPLLMGLSMVIQQRLTPTMGDPTQAKIMMLMPIFFTFIFISFPSGLVLYWLMNNLLSIVQQVYINSKLQ